MEPTSSMLAFNAGGGFKLYESFDLHLDSLLLWLPLLLPRPRAGESMNASRP
jgi:hypothetical protein